MPESLLAILKICALALLYLFFLRVVRAVWAEVSPARVAAPAGPTTAPVRTRRPSRKTPKGGERLVIVEPKETKGRRIDVGEEVTIGRAAGCAVTLEDNYTSQLHARLFRRDGALHVEDLGSTNGTYVNNRKVTAPVPLQRGDTVKVGATVFEVQS
jgi:pSer/pThr/pTyr-binding forkhead associated (FHA) protein